MQGGRAHSIIGGNSAGWLAVLLLLAFSAFLSSRIADERLLAVRQGGKGAVRVQTLLSEISRRHSLAFGFRNFLCDLVWLKAVQMAGPLRMSRGDYDELYVLLDTVINFDPKFKVPYLLGGIILGDSPAHTRESLAVLDRGQRNHPKDWQFPFYVGYIRYFSLGDPVGGGNALVEASQLPESAPYLPLLAARMLSEGRKPETALTFLIEMMNQETNPGRRESLERRVREVVVERDIQALELAAEEYRKRTGGPTERLSDLVSAGLIRGIPEEPNGGIYVITPEGDIRSDRVMGRMKVFRKK